MNVNKKITLILFNLPDAKVVKVFKTVNIAVLLKDQTRMK